MSADNVIKLRPKPLDVLCEAHPGITIGSTVTAATMPSTGLVAITALSSGDALVPLDQPSPDVILVRLVRDHWGRPQMRKAIAALLTLYPGGPPIGRSTQELVSAVIRFCEDPERAWAPPSERTIREAIKIVWPWLFFR